MLFHKKLVACAVMCLSIGFFSVNAHALINSQIYDRTATNKPDTSSPTYAINPRILQLASDNGAYVGVGFGNMWSNWDDQPNNPAGIKGDNGFTFNLDLGYQWNQFLAAEFGYVYFPSAGELSAYATYIAAKMLVPLPYRFNLFVKAGVAYHHLYIGGDSSFFSPVFAGGVAYSILDNLSANLQYMYLGGASGLNDLQIHRVPSGNSITVGLSYNLSV